MSSIELRTETVGARLALVVAILVLLVLCYFTAKWGFANTAAIRASAAPNASDVIGIAEFSASISPGDASAHLAAARALEGSFEPDQLTRSLREYEIAASLRPHDYFVWLALGRAREREGDRESALLMFREATLLAPNYSRVRWSLGNALLRNGNSADGFAEIRAALENDKQYIQPALTIAAQFFDGDSAKMLSAVGLSATGRQGLIQYLARQSRFDEAFAIWNQLPAEEKAQYADKKSGFATQLYQAGRFRESLQVISFAGMPGSAELKVGGVANGGFEANVRLQDPDPFTWRIGTGVYPQIAITRGEKRDGSSSLLVLFSSPHDLDTRSIDQTIAVEPGASYTLNFSYRSDLVTNAEFVWEVAGADKNGVVLGSSDSLTAKKDWTDTPIHFTVPKDQDGVIIRLARRNCTAPQCSIAGNIWFDSFELRKD